jgi:hypothetical protein
MSIALPGSHNILSTMQNALALKTGGRLALDKGFHHAFDDFRWMQENISTRPTWIAEVVLLLPVAEGHHLTLLDWALEAFGFPVPTLDTAWVSLPHNLLYGGTKGQISSPLDW